LWEIEKRAIAEYQIAQRDNDYHKLPKFGKISWVLRENHFRINSQQTMRAKKDLNCE
jgi:hypothetical protein